MFFWGFCYVNFENLCSSQAQYWMLFNESVQTSTYQWNSLTRVPKHWVKELITFDKYGIPGDREALTLYANSPGLEIIFYFHRLNWQRSRPFCFISIFCSLPNKKWFSWEHWEMLYIQLLALYPQDTFQQLHLSLLGCKPFSSAWFCEIGQKLVTTKFIQSKSFIFFIRYMIG